MEKSSSAQAVLDMSNIESAACMDKVPLPPLHRLIKQRSVIAKDVLSESDDHIFKMKMLALSKVNEMIRELLAI